MLDLEQALQGLWRGDMRLGELGAGQRRPIEVAVAKGFLTVLGLLLLGTLLNAMIFFKSQQARNWVADTRAVQKSIDAISVRLGETDEQMRAFLAGDRLGAFPFAEMRAETEAELRELAALVRDNSRRGRDVAELAGLLGHRLDRLERIIAGNRGGSAAVDAANPMSEDPAIRQLIRDMAAEEDTLLAARLTREREFGLGLAVALAVSALLASALVVMVAIEIARAIRLRDSGIRRLGHDLAAKDLLVREVDHRVRNSLMLLYGLVMLQHKHVADHPELRQYLEQLGTKVLAISRVHERLYRSGSNDTLEIGAYLDELCTDLASTFLPSEERAAVRVEAPQIEVAAEQALWLGLIVTEFVINALKFAQPRADSPAIVTLQPGAAEWRLIVADHGAGLPEGFDPKGSKGLGMQVILLLVQQLRGRLMIDAAWSGARFIIAFPAPRGDERRLRGLSPASVKERSPLPTGNDLVPTTECPTSIGG